MKIRIHKLALPRNKTILTELYMVIADNRCFCCNTEIITKDQLPIWSYNDTRALAD